MGSIVDGGRNQGGANGRDKLYIGAACITVTTAVCGFAITLQRPFVALLAQRILRTAKNSSPKDPGYCPYLRRRSQRPQGILRGFGSLLAG
jgi:hypothetical protein